MENNIQCNKDNMKPWLAGLVVLIIIIVGWIIFDKSWNRSFQNKTFAGKTKFNKQKQTAALQTGRDSYSAIVEAIKPAVVGISLPNAASPFLQAWNRQEPASAQAQAWKFGANSLTMPCPNCGMTVTRHTGMTWSSMQCPNCKSAMFCPIGDQVQPQVWMQPSAQNQAQVTEVLTNVKDEYLLCPNCGIRIDKKPGIPWSGAKCPSCSTTLAHVIHETRQIQVGAQKQGWFPAQANNPAMPQQAPALNQPMAQEGFQGIGSGVIISKKGFILTSSHLISGQKNVDVTLFIQGSQKKIPGRVIAEAADRDLAIIKIDPQNMSLTAAAIGNSDTVQVGDTVLAFGNPFGLSQTVTSGIVSAVRKSVIIEGHQLNNLIQTDAPINQGNCGGPLVNLKGEIIGVNTAIYSPGQTHTGLGFAVPINQAKEVFTVYMDAPAQKVAMQYLAYPKVYPSAVQTKPNEDAPVWLGMNIQILNDIIAEQLKIPVDRGILINEVYPNSPAALADLQRGDVIIRFDGKRISDETQLRLLLAEKKPGDTVRLSVLRGRKRFNVKIETAGGAFQQAALNAARKKKLIY